MSETPSVARELAAHAASLRALARDLAGRDADDLWQDTALRALRSPPPRTTGMFGWLVTVMRRLASNRHRDAERRRARERHVGVIATDTAPPATHAVEQRDLARAVSEALWALPETHQRPLLLRYFQGLSPKAIARQLELPLPTVKSRLQRGLAQLRLTLERDAGPDWQKAIGPAFGLSGALQVFWPQFSVTLMSTIGKAALSVAACVVIAVAMWSGPAPEVREQAVVVGEAIPASSAVARDVGAATVQRNVVTAADPTAAAAIAHPFEFELRAHVVDASGQAVGGAHLAVAPPGVPLALSPAASDASGIVAMTFHGKVSTLRVAVGLAIQGQHTALQEVQLMAGVLSELHFVAGAVPLPALVHLDPSGRQIVRLPECASSDASCTNCHSGATRANVFSVRGAFRPGLLPEALFGDPLLPVAQAPVAAIGELQARFLRAVESALVVARDPLSASTASAQVPRLLGRVFGIDGAPVVGITVAVDIGTTRIAVSTRGDGGFELPLLDTDAAVVTLRAGGGPEGLATRTIDLAHRTAGIDLILDPGRTLRGRVLDVDGSGLVGAHVEYVAPGHPGDLATVGPDGSFAFANLPPGRGQLLVFDRLRKERDNLLPLAEVPAVLPDSGEAIIDLRTRPPTDGSLQVFVASADGKPPANFEVRVWQSSTGRGAFLQQQADGRCRIGGLVAGAYRVEAHAIGIGWIDLGVHQVDGLGVVDLGNVPLPQAGRVVFEFKTPVDGLELWSRRADLDVRADELTATTASVDLPPGRWLATWTRRSVHGQCEFVLRAGEVVTVRGDE